MKLLIFENEFFEIEGAFKGLQVLSSFPVQYEVKKSSQEFGDLINIQNYDVVFVDLDLVPSSKLTGYEILAEIISLDIEKRPKIFVLTGHGNAIEELSRRKLTGIPILEKPLGMNDLLELMTIISVENSAL